MAVLGALSDSLCFPFLFLIRPVQIYSTLAALFLQLNCHRFFHCNSWFSDWQPFLPKCPRPRPTFCYPFIHKCLVLTATPRLLTKITPFTCLRCRSFHNHDHDCFITLTKFYRSLNFTKCFLLWPQPFSNFNQVPVTRSWSYASCGDSRSEKRLFGSFWNKLTTYLLCLCKMC